MLQPPRVLKGSSCRKERSDGRTSFVNRVVIALGGIVHVTANLEQQRDGRNHTNSREDKADGSPLPGLQMFSEQ